LKNLFVAISTAIILTACGGGSDPDPINPPITGPGTPDPVSKYEGKYTACDNGLETKLIINDKADTTIAIQIYATVYQYANCSGAVYGEAIYPIPAEFTNTGTAFNYVYNSKDPSDNAKINIDIGTLTIPLQTIQVSGRAKYVSEEGAACLRINDEDSICFDLNKTQITTTALGKNGNEFYFGMTNKNGSWFYDEVYIKR